MRVCLIIPAHNEEEAILDVVREIEALGYHYVVINDGSTDRTERVLQENGVNHIELPFNLGIGGAVQTGHRYAKTHGFDVDIQVDGDGQHDIAFIPSLLEAIEGGADLAIGSRFMQKTEGFQSTGLRRIGIRGLRSCIHLVSGARITDPTSGFRASNRSAIDLFCDEYPIDYPEPESIVAAHKRGLVIREVPVIMRERQGGSSSISLVKGAYYMVKVTLAVIIEGLGWRGRKSEAKDCD